MLPAAKIALTMQPRGRGVTNDHTREAGARMAAALQEAGFTDIDVRTLAPKPVSAACALGVAPSLHPERTWAGAKREIPVTDQIR
jgi:hypothetical protein